MAEEGALLITISYQFVVAIEGIKWGDPTTTTTAPTHLREWVRPQTHSWGNNFPLLSCFNAFTDHWGECLHRKYEIYAKLLILPRAHGSTSYSVWRCPLKQDLSCAN